MELLKRYRNRREARTDHTRYGLLLHRKIVLTGNFFPLDQENFIAKLGQFKGEVQPELDDETEVLICGKYPDWNLISAARKRGIHLIFIDKVSDLFRVARRDNPLSIN